MADFVRSTPFSVGEAFFGLTLLGGLETSLGPWYPTFSIYVHMRYTGGFSESTNGGLRGAIHVQNLYFACIRQWCSATPNTSCSGTRRLLACLHLSPLESYEPIIANSFYRSLRVGYMKDRNLMQNETRRKTSGFFLCCRKSHSCHLVTYKAIFINGVLS